MGINTGKQFVIMSVNIKREWVNVDYLNKQIEALQKENKRLNELLNSK